MIDTPQIVRIGAQHTAVIRLKIPRAEIRKVMGPAIREVTECVAEQGIAATGPVFSHHFRLHPGIFDFEVGVPIAAPISASGRVQPGEMQPATVARTVYTGGYDGLAEAWQQFETWLMENGHDTAPDLWETYLVGPESGLAPNDWCTELRRALMPST